MTPDLLDSLKPFGVAGLALIVLYLLFRRIGFDPVRVYERDGVWIALAFIFVTALVVAFSIWIFRNENVQKDSYILQGSRLSTLFAMSAEDAKRTVVLISSVPQTETFKVDRTLSAQDDAALAELICATYTCISCINGKAGGLQTIDLQIDPTKAVFDDSGAYCRMP